MSLLRTLGAKHMLWRAHLARMRSQRAAKIYAHAYVEAVELTAAASAILDRA